MIVRKSIERKSFWQLLVTPTPTMDQINFSEINCHKPDGTISIEREWSEGKQIETYIANLRLWKQSTYGVPAGFVDSEERRTVKNWLEQIWIETAAKDARSTLIKNTGRIILIIGLSILAVDIFQDLLVQIRTNHPGISTN